MIAIAPTNLNWFRQVSRELSASAINFWTPWNIIRLGQGDGIHFLPQAPLRKIGGYGLLRYYESMLSREA